MSTRLDPNAEQLAALLEAIESGRLSFAEAEQQAPDLAPLLRLVQQTRSLATLPAPRAVEARIMAAYKKRFARPSARWGRFLALSAAAVAFVLMIGGLLLWAAQPAVPGDTLYAYKRAAEALNEALTPDDAESGLLYEHASRRVAELRIIAVRPAPPDPAFLTDVADSVRRALPRQSAQFQQTLYNAAVAAYGVVRRQHPSLEGNVVAALISLAPPDSGPVPQAPLPTAIVEVPTGTPSPVPTLTPPPTLTPTSTATLPLSVITVPPQPTDAPTQTPQPSPTPSRVPTATPITIVIVDPTETQATLPTAAPPPVTAIPTAVPSRILLPSNTPLPALPSPIPTDTPALLPTFTPTATPSPVVTVEAAAPPAVPPSLNLTETAILTATATLTASPSATPSQTPTPLPTETPAEPTRTPTLPPCDPNPTFTPPPFREGDPSPTPSPSPTPCATLTPSPTPIPTEILLPTEMPLPTETPIPPSSTPTLVPSTELPMEPPTSEPPTPTDIPTDAPTLHPPAIPTEAPPQPPTDVPTPRPAGDAPAAPPTLDPSHTLGASSAPMFIPAATPTPSR